MGAATSKETPKSSSAGAIESNSIQESQFNEKVGLPSYDEEGFTQYLRGLDISSGNESAENPINIETLTTWEAELLADPKNRLAQNAFSKNEITSIVGDSSNKIQLKDQYFFNVTVDTIGSPSFFNNQKSSGRCWIFASSNVLRAHVIKNYNLKEDAFQLSQSYLFFYDKLEKANYFLENVIDTYQEPLDSRLIQYLLSSPVSDGGQWDMIINLVNKYGAVPHEVFPDNAQATATSALNYIVTEKLREYALVLRKLLSKGVPKQVITRVKDSMNKQVYNIISLALGSPPKPNDSFVWEFTDKDGKYKYFETNPKDFYKTHIRYDASKQFSLINDPRNPYDSLYTVDRLNNIYGGKPVEYVNTELGEFKQVAIRMLKDNEPIFFGSDVGKFGNRISGVLDTTAYDYSLGFNTTFKIDKAERLRTGSSQMTHAMVITGVHLDPLSGKPVRWKIENSWGDEVGEKGYFVMTDEWFNEYVLQVVTSKKYVSKETYAAYKGKEYSVLPFYDPMSSLA